MSIQKIVTFLSINIKYMEKNKKLNKTKDSLLIGKNSRFSEEVNEMARKRYHFFLLEP